MGTNIEELKFIESNSSRRMEHRRHLSHKTFCFNVNQALEINHDSIIAIHKRKSTKRIS